MRRFQKAVSVSPCSPSLRPNEYPFSGHLLPITMTHRISLECVDKTLADMLAHELSKATVPIALVHEERCDFFYAEVVSSSKYSSLRMAVPQSWLRSEARRHRVKAAARLFRRHVSRNLHPN